MYLSLTFISYVVGAFVALLGAGIILLLISKKEERNSRRYIVTMSFALLAFVQCVLYTGFFYLDIVAKKYATPLLLRVLDFLLCGLILYFWFRVMELLYDGERKEMKIWAWLVGGVTAISGVIATVFFMDDYYSFNNRNAAIIFIVIQAIAVLFAVILILKYTFDFVRISTSSMRKYYVLIVSITVLFWDIQQIIVNSGLYFGKYESIWENGVVDMTGLCMFIIGLATFVYVFKEDFSPLFYDVVKSDSMEDFVKDPLETVAVEHRLTVREVDVLRLLYKGKNNSEIANELYISINTVKKHLKNIYEKTGTSNRVELVYVINQKNNAQQ